MVSVEEYRKLLGDYKSTDEQIQKRLEYFAVFCKRIIVLEIENYVKSRNLTNDK